MACLLALGHLGSAIASGLACDDLLSSMPDFLLIVGCEGVFVAALLWTAGLLREGRCAKGAAVILTVAAALGGFSAWQGGMPLVYLGESLPVRIAMVGFIMIHAMAFLAGFRTAIASALGLVTPSPASVAMSLKKAREAAEEE